MKKILIPKFISLSREASRPFAKSILSLGLRPCSLISTLATEPNTVNNMFKRTSGLEGSLYGHSSMFLSKRVKKSRTEARKRYKSQRKKEMVPLLCPADEDWFMRIMGTSAFCQVVRVA